MTTDAALVGGLQNIPGMYKPGKINVRNTDVHAEPLEPQHVKLQRAICSRVAPQYIWQSGASPPEMAATRRDAGGWRHAQLSAEEST